MCESLQGAQGMFDILSKEVRFVDWALSEEELAPGTPEREASFLKLIENLSDDHAVDGVFSELF